MRSMSSMAGHLTCGGAPCQTDPLGAPPAHGPNVPDSRREQGVAMEQIGMSEEVRELRARMKYFIDNVVIKAEPELDRLAEQGYHPDTGLPMELYEAAEAKGLDTSRGLPGPGDAATRRSVGPIADLQAEAKARGLWVLGHPKEIGGGGLPFMDFVYLNEIIGLSEYGQVAVGSASMQDSIMLHLYASDAQRQRFLQPLVAGDV